MDQHLSVSEAREFSGKSETTIKRLVKEIVGEAGHPDRGYLLPPPEEIERRRASKEPYSWRIDRQLLLRRFPPDTTETASRGSRDAEPIPPQMDLVMHVLQDQLKSKDEQLKTLERQLDRKDEQIASLNDRQQESNVLMRELQQRLAIAPPRETSEAPIVDAPPAAAVTTPAQSKTKKKAAAKKPGLLQRLFRRSV